MARYDRIARLESPARDDAFPAWLVLRDLEGRERESEVARLARLRFVVLRPVRRLLSEGIDGPSPDSLAMQIEGARRALEQFPAHDPERAGLERCLSASQTRSAAAMVDAALAAGAGAEAAHYEYAAEECYRTALELATAHVLLSRQGRALGSLGRIYRKRDAVDEARAYLEAAIPMVEAAGELEAWAEAVGELARVRLRARDPGGARSLLGEVMERGRAAGAAAVTAAGAAGLCALELAEDRTEAAMAAGWQAIELLPPGDERRNPVLLQLAAGFRRMSLRSAAESCYRIVARLSGLPEHRVEAEVEHAVLAAEDGDTGGFRSRRNALLESMDMPAVRPDLRAVIELGLGRGALLVGDTDDARNHLRNAIGTARDARLRDTLGLAEELLSSLEQQAGLALAGAADPSAGVRQIAARIESLGRELVPSG